jgi:phenylalanyl-tRNA synthetase beta chain
VMTYSLVAPGSASWLGAEDGIPVANPLSTEQSVLRTRLLPSLIETARANLRHRAGVAIFELARVYLPPLEPLPAEPTRLGIVMVGQAAPVAWNAPAREADFFDLKGVVEELLGAFSLGSRFRSAEGTGYQPGRCAEVLLSGEAADGRSIGLLGQLHPLAAERLDLGGRTVLAAELEFDVVAAHAGSQPQIVALPRVPGLDRDLALLLERSIPHADVEAALRRAGRPLLESVVLFDAYEGPPIPPGKKSLAYTLRFRAADRTLTDAEADEIVVRIVGSVKERFGAEVRGSGADQG